MGLDQRPLNPKQRLVREDDRPLGNAVQVAAQTHLAEIVEKRRLEKRLAVVAAKRGQIGQIVRLETQIRHEFHRRGQAGRDGESAVKRMARKNR